MTHSAKGRQARLILRSVLIMVTALAGGQGRAANYFVSPEGTDVGSDGSIARPLASIEKALSLAEPGDRVVLRAGEYRLGEALRFPRAGEPGRPITLAAHDDEHVVLLGSVRLAGWQHHQGNIFRCKAPPQPIKGLYEDSERLTHPRQRGQRENPPVANLVAPGRWTEQDGWVYLWTREGDSPDNHRIEASQHGVINLNEPWLRVERLHVFFGQPTGLVISADHCEAVDCEVAHVSNSVDNAYGAYIAGCSNSALRNCRIHDSYYWGDHGSNSHVVSCIDCGDHGPNFVEGCEIFNGGLGVGTKGAARQMIVTDCDIYDVLRGVTISGQRSSGPGAGKTDRGHYLVWHNRIHDCDTGVYFYSGGTTGNCIAGNVIQRCTNGVSMRKVHGLPADSLIANNVFASCQSAIFLVAEREGEVTLGQFAAAGLRSHHNLFFDNQGDWRNPISWTANLDKSVAEIRLFGGFGWEEGSLGAAPLLDPRGRARAGSPTIGRGTPLTLPACVEKPRQWHIGLGPQDSDGSAPASGLTLSIAGSQTEATHGQKIRLKAVLKNKSDRQVVRLSGDCVVTFHFRYAGVWFYDRQEIWRVRVRLPSEELGPGDSIDLTGLTGWTDPTNGALGDPFHLRADDRYWQAGCRLRATARFVPGSEPTARALQRLEPLLRATEVVREPAAGGN